MKSSQFKVGHYPWNKITAPPKEKLEDLYLEKRLSTVDIGEKYGVCHKVVSRWLRHHNILVRSLSEAHKGIPSPKKINISKEKLKRLYCDEGLCLREIAEKYGTSEQVVWKRMVEYDISRRKSAGMLFRDDITEEILKRLYLGERWGMERIAEEFKASSGTIQKYLKHYGIPIRTISESLMGKPKSSEHVRNVLRANAVKPNKSEIRLLEILQDINPSWRYVGDGGLIIDGKCPDFWDGNKGLYEFYGDYWHRGDDPQERIDFFAERGYNCAVIWGHELEKLENHKLY